MYWLREIAGWALVVLGLFIFFAVYAFCQDSPPGIFEAFILMIVGVFVFRGGIHLLKVSVAARLCAKADERLYPAVPHGDGPRPTAARRAAPQARP